MNGQAPHFTFGANGELFVLEESRGEKRILQDNWMEIPLRGQKTVPVPKG